MNHFMLKFTHGVEIGAYLAYIGHFQRTKDSMVLDIALEEVGHRDEIKRMLKELETKSNPIINGMFHAIGIVIQYLCHISPIFLLDKVATMLEVFAVFSYEMLAQKYPQYNKQFLKMAKTEQEHKKFFNGRM